MNEIIIREISDKDYEGIATFHSSFPEEERTYQQWIDRIKYWWDENPAYSPGHPRGVVALDNNRIIGMTSNIPTRMILDGKEVIVINGSSWRVLPDYRKYSMDIWDKHRELTSEFILFNTTAIPQVVKLLKYLKFSEYQVADNWYYYFGDSQRVQKSLKIKLVSILQKSYLKLKYITTLRRTQSYMLRDNASKEDINHLWSQTKNKYDFTNVRDSEYHNWIAETKTIFYLYHKDQLLGFVILHYSEKKKMLNLVDYWGEEILEHFNIIMDVLIKKYRSFNIVIPSYCKKIEIEAKHNLFIKRNIGDKKAYLKAPKNIILNIKNAKLNLLQGDYGL